MALNHPLVTIGLPLYNAESTLADAVASIISQTFPEWELLLLDDGSADGSLTIAKSFENEKITVISDGWNKGISTRLNQAISMARGKYFCRMDADDISFADRLEKQVAFLENHSDIDLVASSVVVFRNDGNLCGVIQVPEHHRAICSQPWRGFSFPHPTWMGKTMWFREHPYSTSADGAEDQLLLYSTCRASCFAGIQEVLLGYREDRRSFKKMLGRRMAFWRALASGSIREGRLGDLTLLSLAQPVKIGADFLNTVLGITGARNRLHTESPAVSAAWRETWEKVNQSSPNLRK